MKHFNKPTYCSVCQSMLLGLGKQGLCCTCESSWPPAGGTRVPHTWRFGETSSPKIICPSPGCKYIVHNQCANRNSEPCARTFVKSKKEIGVSTSTRQHFHFFTLIWVHFRERHQWSNTVRLTRNCSGFSLWVLLIYLKAKYIFITFLLLTIIQLQQQINIKGLKVVLSVIGVTHICFLKSNL